MYESPHITLRTHREAHCGTVPPAGLICPRSLPAPETRYFLGCAGLGGVTTLFLG